MPARSKARGYDSARLTPLLVEARELAEQVSDLARTDGSELGGFSALVLARSCQCVKSSERLASAGLTGDAMTVARTVVELAIDLAYIAKDPGPRIAMFMDHDNVRKYEMAVAVAELHDGAVDKTALDELKRRSDEALARNPSVAESWTRGGNWSGVGVRRRATEADRVPMFKLLYRDMCDASHAGYGTLEYALLDLDGEPKITFKDMPADEGPVVLATGALMALVATVVDASGLEISLGERSAKIVEALTGRTRKPSAS